MSASSGSSDARRATPDGTRALDRLCRRVHRDLATCSLRALSVADHCKAASNLNKARQTLLSQETPLSQESSTLLLCSGVACMRRAYLEADSAQSSNLLRTTAALLFAVAVLSDGLAQPSPEEKEAEELGEELLACWRATTLADAVSGRANRHGSSWSSLVRCSDRVRRAALREARQVSSARPMETLRSLAEIFFRCTATDMMSETLADATASGPATKRSASFLTLDVAALLDEVNATRDQTLASLASAAESEAGQATLRDIILSFKLPRSVVGVRRTLMLSREANASATKNYAETLNEAHEAAVRGATWSWEEDADDVHRVSAVLAGLAILLSSKAVSIRKADAFGGRVVLPFVECLPPAPGATRLGFLEHMSEWVVFSTDQRNMPLVRFRGAGFDAFCTSAVIFSKSL